MTDMRLAVTNVYAPSDHRGTAIFLDGLRELLPHIHGPWLLAGDFNLIRDATEKNTGSTNNSLITAFNNAIDELGVAELPLLDCLFT